MNTKFLIAFINITWSIQCVPHLVKPKAPLKLEHIDVEIALYKALYISLNSTKEINRSLEEEKTPSPKKLHLLKEMGMFTFNRKTDWFLLLENACCWDLFQFSISPNSLDLSRYISTNYLQPTQDFFPSEHTPLKPLLV